MRHIGYIGLDAAALAGDELVTAGLSAINLASAGSLSLIPEAGASLIPLLTSSANSALLPAQRLQMLNDPGELLRDFSPSADSYVLAARIEGELNTAFPEGLPADPDAPDETGAEADSAEADSAGVADANGDSSDAADSEPAAIDAGNGTGRASGNANLIVVADVDVLNDMLWVSRQRGFLGQQVLTAFANNGDFVTNAIGSLAGSEHLIGLKSRAGFARPFDRVEALRRDADARFRQTEQRLQAELAETEQRLGELQAARDDTGSLLMSPEQQAEVDRFQAEQLRIRQELRAVQRELDSSIEGLGTALKLTNIVIVPLALALLALLVYAARRARRRSPA